MQRAWRLLFRPDSERTRLRPAWWADKGLFLLLPACWTRQNVLGEDQFCRCSVERTTEPAEDEHNVCNKSLSLQSVFRSIAVHGGLWQQDDGSQLRTGGAQRGPCFSNSGPRGSSAGEHPDFQRVLSVQRQPRVCCCANGSISELQLDDKRSVGPSLGHSGRAGGGHVYGGLGQPCHSYSHPGQRSDVHWPVNADVQLNAINRSRDAGCSAVWSEAT